jgi:hypothetical protein
MHGTYSLKLLETVHSEDKIEYRINVGGNILVTMERQEIIQAPSAMQYRPLLFRHVTQHR